MQFSGDAHLFVRPDQLLEEFEKVIDIVLYIFRTLKFDNYNAQISLRDPNNKEKYIGSDENWEKAEAAIIKACEDKGLKTTVELGEAAFYGPKLDFMVKDALGGWYSKLSALRIPTNPTFSKSNPLATICVPIIISISPL